MPRPDRLTGRERAELRAARALAALSPRAQVRLSRRPVVRLDGQTLEPEMQMTLALLERRNEPQIETLSPAAAREQTRRRALVAAGRPVPVGAVRELTVAGAEGPLRARLYCTDEPGGPHPLLVFFHGGGFVIGDLDTHDGICRMLCVHAGVNVLAVDYRLAPEHPFPAAVEDGHAALRWGIDNAVALGADPARVAVGGDSAGGNISAVAARLAARDGGPGPALQLLIYPATDATTTRPSGGLFAEGFFLTRAQMDWFVGHYSGDADLTDPRMSPLLADDLSGLAPALVVTAGFDPLRDEGEAYAEALRAAGTPVVLRRFPGLIHGFANAAGISRVSRDALIELAGATRAMLALSRAGAVTREPSLTAR
ncbi:MAG TPA: alpha/beta hydrolase [Solirubrobacteraceae bacterium]|nr:alpha/beta hydrolase [Solirubrobacteraceae bacterium]